MSTNWSKEQQNLPESERLQNDCIRFFREQPVFDRLFQGFRAKYTAYGNFSGTVVVRILSEQDREALEGFFQKNYHGQKSVSVSAARFEKALKDSRFDVFEPKEVLEMYFGETMAGRRELQDEKEWVWQQMLSEAKASCDDKKARQWLDELEEKQGNTYSFLIRYYRETDFHIEEVKKLLELGMNILKGFPYHRNVSEYLAVFAARMTGNPHAFDDGTREGAFFELLVSWDLKQRNILENKENKFFSFSKQRSSLSVGVLRDDISNFVMLAGIRARKKGGELHEGMEGFWKQGEPVHIPLSVLADWESVECPDNEIYIVENPSVFSVLCGKAYEKKACMCMNGQPRLSSILMLDVLAKSDVKIYYAGDFDPEGILIAWKIKQYYKGQVEYWHMSVNDYIRSCSNEGISEKRIKMLERIEDPELSEVIDEIRKKRVAGYQENIMEVYNY